MKLQSLAVSLGPLALIGESRRRGLPLPCPAIGVDVSTLCSDPDESHACDRVTTDEGSEDNSDKRAEDSIDSSEAGECSDAGSNDVLPEAILDIGGPADDRCTPFAP